jgi:hypothetical protein
VCYFNRCSTRCLSRSLWCCITGSCTDISASFSFNSSTGFVVFVAGFSLPFGALGSCFLFGTGYNGLPVLIGTIFLALGTVRLMLSHLKNSHQISLEASIIIIYCKANKCLIFCHSVYEYHFFAQYEPELLYCSHKGQLLFM